MRAIHRGGGVGGLESVAGTVQLVRVWKGGGGPHVTFLKKGSLWTLAWGDVTLPDMALEERGSPWNSGGSSASRSRGSASKVTVDMST